MNSYLHGPEIPYTIVVSRATLCGYGWYHTAWYSKKVQLSLSLQTGRTEYGLLRLSSVSSGMFHDNRWNQSMAESFHVLTRSLIMLKLDATPELWRQY
jgi:hypothetical protein